MRRQSSPRVYSPFTILEDEKPRPQDYWVDVEQARFEKLRAISDGERSAMAFVWPDEGSFFEDGMTWAFNDDHAEFQPLLVDRIAAQMITAVHEALSSDENKAKLRRLVENDRGGFGAVFEIAEKTVTISFKKAGGE